MSTTEGLDLAAFDAVAAIAPSEALIVELDGFEGPLDLLLALARSQKVDIAKISVLQLADQYLAFMEQVRRTNLELAADYLVMAAWLAYLKSRLLLPQAKTEEEMSADDVAMQLRWRLKRLEMMREAGTRLMARERLDRDVFARGAPEPLQIVRTRRHVDNIFDLLTAYSQQRVRKAAPRILQMARAPVFLIEEARARLELVLGKMPEWSLLVRYLPPGWTGERRRSAIASTFSACLELARDGRLQLRQLVPFGEIFLKDSVPAQQQEATR